MRGALILEDGAVFEGQVFGRGLPQRREVVCVAGVSWSELLTAPAYTGQIVAAVDAAASPPPTAAPAGAERLYPSGLLLNGAPVGNAHDVAWQAGLAGLSGVNTHALASHLRRSGPLSGTLIRAKGKSAVSLVPATLGSDHCAGIRPSAAERAPQQVSVTRPFRIYGGGPKVIVYDYGVSPDLLYWLSAADCHTTVVPWDYPAASVQEMMPDVVVLSGGPGNPASADDIITGFRPLLGEIPLLGIGLGHQLLARSQGARTGAMWCGHRAHDVAVRELDSGRVVPSWQSHGYAVLGAPVNARITHVAVQDGSIEGLIYPELGAASVQFTPGPYSASSAMAQVWRSALSLGGLQRQRAGALIA